jgi:hypothetical protein
MWNREEVFHAVLPHVLCRADAMATTIVLTIPAVTIYVNLGFEVASCDAIAEESIPTLSAPGQCHQANSSGTWPRSLATRLSHAPTAG